MQQLKAAFLISPLSGTGEGDRVQRELPHAFEQMGLSRDQYHIQPITDQDVVDQAAELASRCERLIVLGGDGTAAAAIAGVWKRGAAVPVGVIPFGTGNDLARVMNTHALLQKKGLKECIKSCLHAPSVQVDVWQVNTRQLMVNYLSIGVDAAVVRSYSTNRRNRQLPYRSAFINRCVYAGLAVPHAFTHIKGDAIITCRRGERRKTFSLRGLRGLVISNIPKYAGGTLVAPDAQYSDHHLDITPFSTILNFAGLFLFQLLPPWQRWYGRKLKHYEADKVDLRLGPGNYLQIDGEDRTGLLEETYGVTIEYAGKAPVIKVTENR